MNVIAVKLDGRDDDVVAVKLDGRDDDVVARCRAHARDDSPPGYALMPRQTWLAIKRGESPPLLPASHRRPLTIPTPEQQATIDARKAICKTCPENQRITDRGVKCRDCGCGLVSFIHGRCKLGKWDTP